MTSAKSLGVGIIGITGALHDYAPNVKFVAGDRNKMLAFNVIAANMNMPLAHIHGGDQTVGAIIEKQIQHTLTTYADLLFTASVISAERIRKFGE